MLFVHKVTSERFAGSLSITIRIKLLTVVSTIDVSAFDTGQGSIKYSIDLFPRLQWFIEYNR